MNNFYTCEKLQEICKNSNSLAEVLRKLNIKPSGGNYATIKRKIKLFDIDTSHFSGKAWNKGKKMTFPKEKYNKEEIFVSNSKITPKVLRGYVRRHNIIPYKCYKCGCDGNWQDGVISLELDHINGINDDNRIDNLRYSCPNCHALTPTYRGRNKIS